MKKTYLEPIMWFVYQNADIITTSSNTDGGISLQNDGNGDQIEWIG